MDIHAPALGNIAARAPNDNNNNATTTNAPITVTVNANTAPTITLTSPANNAGYTAPASIALAATAADTDGTITQVQFFANGNPIGAVSNASYTATWAAVPAGSYVFTAVATDNGGLTTTSAAVTVTVNATAPAGLYFIHPDHLNTPRLITDASGTPVWRWENDDPFGNNTPNENPNGVGQFSCNLWLPGQYFDRETNLHYNYFRDYDPVTGRYVQSDPIGLRGGVNTYAYVGGNPVSFADPEGLQVFPTGQVPAAVHMHNRWNSSYQQFNREFGDKAFPYPAFPGRPEPPGCFTTCMDDGGTCRPVPVSGVPIPGRPGCFRVCWSAENQNASPSPGTTPPASGPEPRQASAADWLRLRELMRR